MGCSTWLLPLTETNSKQRPNPSLDTHMELKQSKNSLQLKTKQTLLFYCRTYSFSTSDEWTFVSNLLFWQLQLDFWKIYKLRKIFFYITCIKKKSLVCCSGQCCQQTARLWRLSLGGVDSVRLTGVRCELKGLQNPLKGPAGTICMSPPTQFPHSSMRVTVGVGRTLTLKPVGFGGS